MSEPKREDRLFNILAWAVAFIVFGIFVEIILPNLVHRQPHASSYNACINNLRQIDAAANEFALENSRTNGDPIRFPDDLTPYIKLDSHRRIPQCPSGGIYSLSRIGDKPLCSLGMTNRIHVLP